MNASASTPPLKGPEADAIEATAAVWLGRRDRGMSEAETATFIRWLQQDARHAEVFAELDDTWKNFNRLHLARPAGAGSPDADLLAPRRRRSHRTRCTRPARSCSPRRATPPSISSAAGRWWRSTA